jgi:CubicO group peptidase (beta-lactamase class C family)
LMLVNEGRIDLEIPVRSILPNTHTQRHGCAICWRTRGPH